MKILDIAIKDLWHSFRSAFALVFMFVIPILTVGLFYFAFGGIGSESEEFSLPTTIVQVVNGDEPVTEAGTFLAGDLLVDMLRSEELDELLDVEVVADVASAKSAVDGQRAGVAVIIPPDFTSSLISSEGDASVRLYQDPTLNVGPGIVKNIISQFIDGFAGSIIAREVATEQLTEDGLTVTQAITRDISRQYAAMSTKWGENQQDGTNAILDVRVPEKIEEEGDSLMIKILRPIIIGMMIFYAFFTGANSSQTILAEADAGTLPRLFTTPTPISTVLGGKFLAVFITIIIQVAVLVGIATLVLELSWGSPLSVMLVALGLVVSAAGFGIFLTSLLTTSEQVGIVFGGALTVTGMIGISPMFTGNVPGTSVSGLSEIIALFTPQGWAMRGWGIAIQGGTPLDVLPTVGVMLALGAIFFAIGTSLFRRRFSL